MTPYSIVVAAHNHPRELLNVLIAVREHASPTEVLVVDNASTMDLRGVLGLSQLPNVRLRRLDQHRSLAAALNAGLDSASNEIALLMHGDVLLRTDPAEVVDWLVHEPTVGIVGGKLFRPEGKPKRLSHAGYMIGRGRIAPMPRGWYEWDHYTVVEDMPAVSDACMLLRLTDLRFDERFWFCLEDVDLCFQYQQHGYRVMFHPDLQAVDFEAGGLQEKRSNPDWANRELQTRYLYHERWCSDESLLTWPKQRAVRCR